MLCAAVLAFGPKFLWDRALPITLGVVVIVGIPYSLLQACEIVPQKGETAVLTVLMSITYMTSIIVGLRRYR